MSQYNILQAIYLSFFSKKLYRDVAINWGGKSFLYLFMLVALSWILLAYQMQQALNLGYHERSTTIVEQIPVLNIKDGKITTPENKPYLIVDPNNKEKIVVIDTTGQYKTLDEAGSSILITQTEVITQSNPHQVRIDKVPDKLSMQVNPQEINGYIKHYIGFAWIFILLFIIPLAFIYRVIQALIYSIIGKIFSAIYGTSLTYMQIVQIAMVSITPVIIFGTIADYFIPVFPHRLLFYFILAIIYLFYGIAANKNQNTQ